MANNIIIHYPFELNYKAKSASGIRPIKMLEAFKGLGYEIELISGNSKIRKQLIENVINRIKNGYKYEFVYSESSTMPTALTDKHHLPLRPFIDYNLFRVCKKNKIPIGLFYRDIYWLFPAFSNLIPNWKAQIARIFYKLDLFCYNKYLKFLYTPSIPMQKYIPIISIEKFKTLPPANDCFQINEIYSLNKTINLFYVGGVGLHYQMHELFKALKALDNVQLTICTRANEWAQVEMEYRLLYKNYEKNISIVHLSGDEMIQKLKECDVALIFVKPQEYWNFAVPYKFFEYLGFGKPIIASSGTFAGTLVSEHEIGFTINYNFNDLINTLNSITLNPSILGDKIDNIRKFSENNTWRERALQVCNDLIN